MLYFEQRRNAVCVCFILFTAIFFIQTMHCWKCHTKKADLKCPTCFRMVHGRCVKGNSWECAICEESCGDDEDMECIAELDNLVDCVSKKVSYKRLNSVNSAFAL